MGLLGSLAFGMVGTVVSLTLCPCSGDIRRHTPPQSETEPFAEISHPKTEHFSQPTLRRGTRAVRCPSTPSTCVGLKRGSLPSQWCPGSMTSTQLLSQASPLVLEASSQWDEGTRAVPGSSHAGYGTNSYHCSAVCQPAGRSLALPGTPNSPEPSIRGCRYSSVL